MRAQIFDAVAQIGKPASAYEIADIVSRTRGKRVAPNSVYRILDLFVANNLVRRVESANAFVANSHPGCLHRSEEHTSELQSLMRISYAVFCLKKKNHTNRHKHNYTHNTHHTHTSNTN